MEDAGFVEEGGTGVFDDEVQLGAWAQEGEEFVIEDEERQILSVG